MSKAISNTEPSKPDPTMKDDKTISRREFLKRFGLGAALTTAALTGCAPKQQKTTAKSASEPEAEKMTYRTTPTTGDRVSLLGYGCMRWPLENQKDRNSPIDQEATNALVDYAIEHGVNYFDTAPVYGRGLSLSFDEPAVVHPAHQSAFIFFNHFQFDRTVIYEYFRTYRNIIDKRWTIGI